MPRLFQIIANGKTLELVGQDQVAELIGLLGQALRDSCELQGKPIRQSWAQQWEYEPVKMECRQVEAPLSIARKLLTRKPVPMSKIVSLEMKQLNASNG